MDTSAANINHDTDRLLSEPHPGEADLLARITRPIAEQLTQVDAVLRGELRSEHEHVDELVRYGCLLGGKRLRPVLLLLSAKALGEVTREHVVLAAVVEMVHTATLVHDDVLDEAQTRRHLATVNSRWDNKTSVLLGDFLFTHAFYLASTLGSALACQVIGRATNTVCEGELRQKDARGDFSLSEDQYLDIIASKTAELCACSCYLGAYYATHDDGWADAMAHYGRDLGVAFQIVDDILDLRGDEQRVGKSLGTDLAQQKATLPLIRALETAEPPDRREMLALVQGNEEPQADRLLPYLIKYEAVEYAYQVARRFALRAADRLSELRESPASESLRQLSSFVIDRAR